MSGQAGGDRARKVLCRDSVKVAPLLLGATLTSSVGGARVTVRISEVEAYRGADDPASHAHRGPTARNQVMFGPPGYLYCYFTYGMHWCANVVCQFEGVAAAVLLRGGEVVSGESVARERRRWSGPDRDLARGPARLAQALGLGAEVNGLDLLDACSPVRLTGLRKRRPACVLSGPRVGITRATDKPWRFWLDEDRTVSAFRPGVVRAAHDADRAG